MSEEDFRKIAKEYAEMYFTKGIDSTKIFKYVDELEKKVEQLESIRKEVIEILKELRLLPPMEYEREEQIDNLLNILNKGSDKE